MPDLGIIKKKIRQAKEIIVAGHINPDGDSIGSLLSLGLALETLNKRIYMISPDGVPKKYTKLPGAGRIIKYFYKPVDLAIAVDCGNKELLGSAFAAFKKAKDVLEIDHHEFRRPFGNLSFIEHDAAAVSELIYVLLKEMKIKITKEVAYNLLASMIIETESFRLPNVRRFTFKICSELMATGLNFHKLVDMIFWSRTKESIILSGTILSRCKFMNDNRLVWSIIRQKDFQRLNGRDEDVDAVADEMRSIQTAQIAVLFREKEKNSLRVSLRSKGKINVARIAEDYGGGGHFDVAGCNIPNKSKTIKELLSMANSYLK